MPFWIGHRPDWQLPESAVTPEDAAVSRRTAMLGTGAGLMALRFATEARAQSTPAQVVGERRDPRFVAPEAVTPEAEATSYNNYYEFGSHKGIAAAARRLPQAPWTLRLDGLVGAPRDLAIEDLPRLLPVEERVSRHRCVEAWSMVVPWTGIPLAALVRLAEPRPEARYLRFETAAVPSVMPGLRQSWYPWPYVEGCTLAEASNELAFLVTGAYGKPLPAQNGGPVRVHFPWKYGFKSGKSLVRISFVAERPKSFWEAIQPQEYGFWANVNPEVPHPRWSQATERVLGTNERVPTRLFNGYASFVADLYRDLPRERLWT